MFICLFVCPLAYLKNQIFDTLPVAVAPSYSDGNAICYNYISGFVDDVTFPYNEGNRPESKTTCMFRSVRQVAAPGAKSAVSGCILFSFVSLALWIVVLWRSEARLIKPSAVATPVRSRPIDVAAVVWCL